MERVTGIGGVFLKAKDPKKMTAWYDKHLGLNFGESTYLSFKDGNGQEPSNPGETVFSFFKYETKYFDPSASPFMINFRVKNLESLFEKLKEEGVEIVGEMMKESYGNFGWILDPEGNKIELWEAIDDKAGK